MSPESLVITTGCQEALMIAIRAVAKPGDTIAIESPSYYGVLQCIESLGMRALEIPTEARTGISLNALELALDQWPIKALVVTPQFSNPLVISEHFPPDTRLTHPEGGYLAWVEMDKSVDSLELFQQAMALGMSLAPGPLFSAVGKYRNYMRINYSMPWNDERVAALATIGQLIEQQIEAETGLRRAAS